MQRNILTNIFGNDLCLLFKRNRRKNEKLPQKCTPKKKRPIMNPEKPSVHEVMKPLEWLVGTWEGGGTVTYPTMKPVAFDQIIKFRSVGQENFMYTGDTWTAVGEKLLHKEYGFLRMSPNGKVVQFVLVHNSGFLSIEEGLFNCGDIKFESVKVQRSPTSHNPEVKSLERNIKFTETKIKLLLRMSTACTKLSDHIKATYEKIS